MGRLAKDDDDDLGARHSIDDLLTRAAESARLADEATLPHIIEKHRLASEQWSELARRAKFVERRRRENHGGVG